MWWRYPYNPTAYTDDWESQPAQGPFYQWGLGVVVPLIILGYGLHAIILKQAEFGDEVSMTIHGLNAIALGIAAMSAGLFLHCHYFWGNIYNDAWFAVLGKIVAVSGFIAGMGIIIIRVGIYGMG